MSSNPKTQCDTWGACLSHAPIATGLLAADGTWLEVNDSLCTLLGHPSGCLRGESFESVLAAEDIETLAGEQRALRAGQIPLIRAEHLLMRADGSSVWGELFISGSGMNEILLVQVVDITTRKEAEKELVHQHQFLTNILEDLPIPIGSCEGSSPQIINFMNRHFTQMFGYTREDLPTDLAWFELAYPDPEYREATRKRWQAVVQQALQDGHGIVKPLEVRVTCKNGETRDVILHAKVSNDAKVLAFIDQTELRRTARDLEESNGRFERALQQSRTVVWECDPAGVFTYVSPSVELVYGYKPEEIIGIRKIDDYLPTDADMQHRAAFTDDLLTLKKETFHSDIPSYARSGEIVWTECHGVPVLDDDGNLIAYRGTDVDITSRRMAEESLRASESRLMRILEYLPIPMAVNTPGPSAKIQFINRQFTRTFGYTYEDIPTVEDWARQAYPDEAYRHEVFSFWDLAVARAMEGSGLVEPGEFQVVAKDGSIRDVIISATGIDGTLMVAFLDITARKKAAAELEAARQALEASAYELTENIPAGTYAIKVSPQGVYRFIFASTRFIKMLEIDHDAVLADPVVAFDVIHPEDRPGLDALNDECASSREPFRWEGRLVVGKPSRIVWVRIESNPRQLMDGSVVWEGVVTDITTRKEAEEALEGANYMMQLASLAAGIGFWEYDMENHRQIWDDRMFQLYGIRRKDFDGQLVSWEKFVHPDDLAAVMALPELQQRDGSRFSQEFRIIRGDGEERHIRSIGMITRNFRGTPLRMTGVNFDVTLEKQAEENLRVSLQLEQKLRQQAEKAHAAQSRFLANMSHEVRTPLSALVSLAQAMWMESEKQNLTPEFSRFLNRVRSGGQYLNLILTNLLDYSASEAGRTPLRAEKFYIADWAEDLHNILEPIAEHHGVRLDWKTPANDDARIHTDPMRLTQIVLNLGHNAVKFTAGFPDAAVSVRIQKKRDGLHIVVEDNGPGIVATRIEEMFGAFRQGSATIPAADHGVGLGLAVVRLNLELLGGDVEFGKREGGGSRFEVRVPLKLPKLPRTE